MAIILSPEVSRIEDGLELEEIKEAVADPHRYGVRNVTGSRTIIGSTEDEQKRVITTTIKHKSGRTWIVLEAHKATQEERQQREEHVRRASS